MTSHAGSQHTPDNDAPNGRIESLIADTKTRLGPGLDDKVQTELAELLGLLHYLTRPGYSHLVGIADIAIAALLSEPPNLKFAKATREKLSHLVRPSPFKSIFSGTPPTRVILGLGTLLYFAVPLLLIIAPIIGQSYIMGLNSEHLVVVGMAGAIGSVVSIMVRIQDFSGLRNVDPSVLFFTGFFKPVVGASFAMFVFSALQADIIPIDLDPDTELYFFIALSFVAGFSERIAKDIMKTTERQIGGATGDN